MQPQPLEYETPEARPHGGGVALFGWCYVAGVLASLIMSDRLDAWWFSPHHDRYWGELCLYGLGIHTAGVIVFYAAGPL